MARLFVIEHRCWKWTDELRLPGIAGTLPDAEDLKGLNQFASEMAESDIGIVLTSDCEDTLAVATAMSQMLSGSTKLVKDSELREIDFGLWQGLTIGELRGRYTKAYRQWMDDPENITASSTGESFDDVAERLLGAINSAVAKYRDKNFLMVLSPLAAAILHCKMYGRALAQAIESLADEREIRVYDLERISLVEDPQ